MQITWKTRKPDIILDEEVILKFIYSEKAKKICKIFNVDLTGST